MNWRTNGWVGRFLLATLWFVSLLVASYYLLEQETSLVPTVLGHLAHLGALLAFGAAGYYAFTTIETPREGSQIVVRAIVTYGVAGVASAGHSIHQYSSSASEFSVEGAILESIFVALIGGIAGIFIGLEVVRRDRSLDELQEERNRFSTLIQNMPDPLVEYELYEETVVIHEANDPFIEQFGLEPPFDLAELNETIAGLDRKEEAVALDERITGGERVSTEVLRRTEDGRRWFKLRTFPNHRNGGFAIYTDFTEQHLRSQQVSVLSRVLRHNLRNNLTVATGLADRIAVTTESEEIEESASQIRSTTEELLETAERIKTIRDHLDDDPPKPEPTEIAALVRDRVADARSSLSDAEFEFDCRDELWVQAHPTLAVVVDTLVEAMVEYNDRDEPRVSVSLDHNPEETDGYAVIRIEDNGSGLPTQELVDLKDDAEPTPLKHASDVDLWMANWFVDQFGGALHATVSESEGTTFEITLEVV